ncbi:MAG TPA: ATPase, T2SS/T4P/T4SS family [Vicinamibacteria bacterium]|nr:ATPase, T2SS/T4P/T4SS family [Vicinamibacteria bacterium]
MSTDTYTVRCWNCLNDFEAVEAVWCSCDPKHPSKLCPFCLNCFCPADDVYKKVFWDSAPDALKSEVSMLERGLDRLGEILIRNQKLKTPQLLEALREQERTGGLLGKILLGRGWVTEQDIDDALRYQGYQPLVDTQDLEVTPAPATISSPVQILEHLLTLAARREASDIHLEPTQTELGVKLRIDGLFYKVKPLKKEALEPMLTRIYQLVELDARREDKPQNGSARIVLEGRDYDLLVQTLPTRLGTSVGMKLVDRRFFLKNFSALGLSPADQLFLVRAIDAPSGLIMLSAPPNNGAMTTSYSLMDYVVKSERRVVSIERAIQWEVPHVQQLQVDQEKGIDYSAALRSAASAKPDVVFILELNDRTTATLASQLATTFQVIATFPAFGAAESVHRFLELGVPPSLLARGLTFVMNQRLVRRICPHCRDEGISADPDKLSGYGISTREAKTLKLYKGRGCSYCNRLGYRRRKGLFELIVVDQAFRETLGAGPSLSEIDQAARNAGMETLRQRCLKEVGAGVTSLEEFIRWRM